MVFRTCARAEQLLEGGLTVDDGCGRDDELVFGVQIREEPDGSHLGKGDASDEVHQDLLFLECYWSPCLSRWWVEKLGLSWRYPDLVFCKPHQLENSLLLQRR